MVLVALAHRLTACGARHLKRSPTCRSGLNKLGRLKRGLGLGSSSARGRLARNNALRRSLGTSQRNRGKMEAAAAEAVAVSAGSKPEWAGAIPQKVGGEEAGNAPWLVGVVPHEGLLLRALWPAAALSGLAGQDAAEMAELGVAGHARIASPDQHSNYA